MRLLGWGRGRPELEPAAGAEASSAMERSFAMRWVRALGVTSVEGGGWGVSGVVVVFFGGGGWW